MTLHSGTPVTAEDAEFSLRRAAILNKTPYVILTQLGLTPESVEDTIHAEGNTQTITTDKPYATSVVLNCLTAAVGSIVAVMGSDEIRAMQPSHPHTRSLRSASLGYRRG